MPTSISAACCSAVFTGTKRIVGRLIASQSASASAASFLPRLTYGLTSCGAINFTECPNDCSSRAQWWLAPQASIAITVGASFSRNANISLRRSFLRRTDGPAATLHQIGDAVGDPVDVLLDRDDHVAQHRRAARAGDHEHVREAGDGEPEIRVRPVAPLVA